MKNSDIVKIFDRNKWIISDNLKEMNVLKAFN